MTAVQFRGHIGVTDPELENVFAGETRVHGESL